jgi:hypothetical protein
MRRARGVLWAAVLAFGGGCSQAELKADEVAAKADAYSVATFAVGVIGDLEAAKADWTAYAAAHPAEAATAANLISSLATKAGITVQDQTVFAKGLNAATAPEVLPVLQKVKAGLAPTKAGT